MTEEKRPAAQLQEAIREIYSAAEVYNVAVTQQAEHLAKCSVPGCDTNAILEKAAADAMEMMAEAGEKVSAIATKMRADHTKRGSAAAIQSAYAAH